MREEFRTSSRARRTGLARALSKLGICSRSRASQLIQGGRVRVNGAVRRDPEFPVTLPRDRIELNREPVLAREKIYLMLNKPRGPVTTASDEQDRATVFAALADKGLPHVTPVGRLDKASEGLLLFTNDTLWAAAITSPASHIDKIYHVQVGVLADNALLSRLCDGVRADEDFLRVQRAAVLRTGEKNSWLELVLHEGKNRHIRRLLGAFDIPVLRLIRVAVGPLKLGNLPKGRFRFLTGAEVKALRRIAASGSS
jgi:23S rRNA pseudouridine2605 synthase